MTLLGSEHSLLIRSKFRSGRAKALGIPSSTFPLLHVSTPHCFPINVSKPAPWLLQLCSPEAHLASEELYVPWGAFNVFCCKCFES